MASRNNILNSSDQLVLESIFSPNLPFDAHDGAIDDNDVNSIESNSATYCENDAEWKKLEADAIQLAEQGELDEALVLFDKAVQLQPNEPAGYNNRAQLLRLKGDTGNAKKDLDMSIAKSNGRGAAACQAFTQKAMIRRLEGDDDGCRADFQRAADLGSKFAKQQLVALNPYAALCNSMLSEMISKVRKGEPTNAGDPAA